MLENDRVRRSQLRRPPTDWDDGRPHTDLHFEFHCQATNEIVGVSGAAAAYLGTSS